MRSIMGKSFSVKAEERLLFVGGIFPELFLLFEAPFFSLLVAGPSLD